MASARLLSVLELHLKEQAMDGNSLVFQSRDAFTQFTGWANVVQRVSVCQMSSSKSSHVIYMSRVANFPLK